MRIIKNKYAIFLKVFLLNLLFMHNAQAKDIYTCEAKSVGGNRNSLEIQEYEKIYPTIIIEKNSLIYLYNRNNQQLKFEYKILNTKQNELVGIRNLKSDYVDLIHMNLKQKVFSTFIARRTLNQMDFGKCSLSIN